MTLKITHPTENVLMSPCLNLGGHREGEEVRMETGREKKDSREGKRRETRRERCWRGEKELGGRGIPEISRCATLNQMVDVVGIS